MNKKQLFISIALAVSLWGCGDKDNQVMQAPASLVEAEKVVMTPYQERKSFIGRAEAVEDTSIIAQVTGYLQGMHFHEGQIVEKGQLLYTVDPTAFQAQVASAKADVAKANSALQKAQLDFNRGKKLLPKGSISQAEFDSQSASLSSAKAQLEAAQAQLNLANVNLSHTEIRAPFRGRVSDSKVSLGDLVSSGIGALTTIVSLDPIHVSFRMSERERLELGVDKIAGDGGADDNVDVQVILENSEKYAYLGRINFLSNRIDLTTGTIAMRAVVPNPNHRLLPGQHVMVQLMERTPIDVLVVPRRAVQTDLQGDYVMMVAKGNIAERRNVELGEQTDKGVIIKSGVKADEQVIVQGLQRVRNGAPVRFAKASAGQ